jgi:hypothetical protein
LDVSDNELVEGANVAEAARAVLEVLDEAFLCRDGVEVFGPGFKVTDAAGELDADLTGF